MKKYGKFGNADMLEIGSGNGAFAFWLSRNGNYHVDAIELDSNFVSDCEAIKKEIKRDNLCFISEDASRKLPMDEKYNIIFSSHVLEHIHDDTAVLVNAYEYLKPGGYLILQVPYGIPQKLPTKEGFKIGHVREGYTESKIRGKLECVGFEVITATGSVGRIGRIAYRFAKMMAELSHRLNIAIVLFPITLLLIYLEQIAVLFRTREPPFMYWPAILAKKPL